MNRLRQISHAAGLLWLLVFAAYTVRDEVSNPALWRESPPQGADGNMLEDRRFSDIRRALPDHGLVGYVSDVDLSSAPSNTRWVVAQYHLAPVVLVSQNPGSSSPDPRLQWGIADCADPSAAAMVARSAGFAMVKDFGGGVWLLHRESK